MQPKYYYNVDRILIFKECETKNLAVSSFQAYKRLYKSMVKVRNVIWWVTLNKQTKAEEMGVETVRVKLTTLD